MSWRMLTGDALALLPTLPAASVQCVVTSPPYWGLRDYGTATWEGGDATHPHVGEQARTLSGGLGKQYTNAGSNRVFSGNCSCGARRLDLQIGLEATPEVYTAALVAIFHEVRRVLRDDGVLWLNLGDSYSGQINGPGSEKQASNRGASTALGFQKTGAGLKPKDLVGIPWRVAFALQADGWYLRADVIWAKPNPMPESVTDRPTKAHEYLFLLAKAERYFYDAEAIAEPTARPESIGRSNGSWGRALKGEPHGHTATGNQGTHAANIGAASRNRRSVWTIATQPYPEAHFATFPEALVEPCVLAGSRRGDTVLDPFAGAGTTLYVAHELGRHGLGIELNPSYVTLAERRLRQEVLALDAPEPR